MGSIQAFSITTLPVELLSTIVEKVLGTAPVEDMAQNLANLARVCKAFQTAVGTHIPSAKRVIQFQRATKISFVCQFLKSAYSLRLAHLDFTGYTVTNDVLDALSSSPVRTRLKTLVLSGSMLREANLATFLQRTSFPALTTIEILNADLTNAFLTQIPLQCPTLTSLTLKRCTGLDDAALTTIVSRLVLKELVLAPAELSSAYFLQEMGKSPTRTSLEHFELQRCLNCSGQFKEMAQNKVHFDNVKRLSLFGSPTEPETTGLLRNLFPSACRVVQKVR